MIGRRATVAIALLCALLFCACAAQSASAATSTNTTAFTCVKDPQEKGDFTDAHCDKTGTKGDEEYKHVSIANNVTTSIEFTNDKMGFATGDKTSQLLKTTAFATKTEITCDTVKGKGEIHNIDASGKHTVAGVGTIEYTGCKVLKPAKCAIKEPIVIKNSPFEGVDGLGTLKNQMGIEFRPEAGGVPFAEITFQGLECAFKGKSINVDGTAIATSNSAVGDTAKESGATATFTEAMTKETLKVGVQVAEHKGGFTVKMATEEGEEQNPISFTTT